MKSPKKYEPWINDISWKVTRDRISLRVKKHPLVDDLTVLVDNLAVKKRVHKYRSAYNYQPGIFEKLERDHPELFELAEAVLKPPMERFVAPHSMFSRTRSKSNTSGQKRTSSSQMFSNEGNSAELGARFQLALNALLVGGDITEEEWCIAGITINDGSSVSKLAAFCIMTTEDKIYF